MPLVLRAGCTCSYYQVLISTSIVMTACYACPHSLLFAGKTGAYQAAVAHKRRSAAHARAIHEANLHMCEEKSGYRFLPFVFRSWYSVLRNMRGRRMSSRRSCHLTHRSAISHTRFPLQTRPFPSMCSIMILSPRREAIQAQEHSADD